MRLRLALWLSSAIAAVAVVAGGYAFWQTFEEVHDLQDDVLRQVAALVSHAGEPAMQALQHATDDDELDIDDDTQLRIQPLGQPAAKGDGYLPDTLPSGLHTLDLDGTGYRLLVHSLPGGQRFAVMQETSLRNEIALNSAMLTVLPLLLLVPLLVLMTVLLVHRMLKPVATLAREVDARHETALHAVSQHKLPSEIRPFVHAINRLLARVDQSMAAQRRFVADAAHELRSPMTALSLQAQRLAAAEMSPGAQERLHSLQQGIERNRRLLDQLLTMARAQEASAAPAQAVELNEVFRQVLEDLMPLAEARHIDLGLVEGAEGQGLQLHVQAVDALTVVKNLVDNAIRYAPDGGRVDVSARQLGGSIVIEVQDNGPGIAAHERSRVLDAFYRVAGTEATGSGLGLSIVQAIVQRWGGRIELLDAPHATSGLLVRVHGPLH
ncbi:MAG: ATP-binding protein [Brachymonas sp.]|nr:ATP-binding protein [Brachymonas sp.]